MAAALENDDLLVGYEATGQPRWRVYEPRRRVIVLGAAGAADLDVHAAAAAAAGIEIRRRRGGGGTVLLGPGQVVVALVTEVDHPYRNREYAHAVNDWLIDALHGDGVRGIEQRGISDLAIGGRKIAGTSVFRRRRILFYQASLLVDTIRPSSNVSSPSRARCPTTARAAATPPSAPRSPRPATHTGRPG